MNNNVSIIIPTNASRASIFKSIDSVMAQIYEGSTEIIVVVNGKIFSEEILDKLKSYKDIKLLNSPQANGNAARHLGVEKSQFDFIAFLDDDDTWENNKLELQIKKLIIDGANFSYTARNILTPFNSYTTFKKPLNNNYYNLIAKENFVGGFSSVLLTKELYSKVGGLDLNLSCFQDYEFYLRVMKFAVISFVDLAVVNYSQHFGVKISNNYKINKQSVEQILRKYKDHVYFESLKKSLKNMLLRKGVKYLNIKMILYSQTL